MRKLIVKLKDATSSFVDPSQSTGSVLIFGLTEKEVEETDTIKRGIYGGALIAVSVVDETAKEVPVIEEKEATEKPIVKANKKK